MTARISDERLEKLYMFALPGSEVESALHELQKSRARDKALRALAERMRNQVCTLSKINMDYVNGKQTATDTWLSELDSLLAAHDKGQSHE